MQRLQRSYVQQGASARPASLISYPRPRPEPPPRPRPVAEREPAIAVSQSTL